MIKPYALLEGVLDEIEKNLKSDINDTIFTDKFFLSSTHLRRLFKFAFGQSLGAYIRSRKLAASIEELLLTNLNIFDIAVEYGFDYEQSYIRAFKREYGITPGELRKSGQIVKIKPPLQLFDSNKLGDNLIFGPDIVMVPQFHVVGKRHKLPNRDALVLPKSMKEQFSLDIRKSIPNVVNPDVMNNICSLAEKGANYHYFMPAVQVKTLDNIPEGYDYFTFPTTLCAMFRFINHTLDEINMHLADGMFQAIDDFMDSKEQKYFLDRSLNVDKFDLTDKYGNYLQWEWFAPVIDKTSLKIAPFNPSGIKKTYQQELPALRFIGKKCIETSETANVLNLLDNWQLKGWFNDIEKQSCIDNAYINLVRKKDSGISEHWMGMFMPEGTEVPQGYEAIDFPPSTLAVCSVYGKRDEIAKYERECRHKLTEEGFTPENARCYFRRFNWSKFFNLDEYGKRTLEYGFYL